MNGQKVNNLTVGVINTWHSGPKKEDLKTKF